MIRFTFVVILFYCSCFYLKAQESPFYYIHSFNNLYLQNPSMAGSNGHALLFLTYHKQLTGITENAPQHVSISGNSPIGNSRSSLGFNIYNFKRGYISTVGGLIGFAHRVDFGNNHNLRLGMSIGVQSNNFDLDLVQEQDDALANKLNNKTKPDAQFGINYQIGHLQIGVVLPKLFKTPSTNNNQLITSETPFQNFLFTAFYDIEATKDLVIKPLVVYRSFQYDDVSGVEGNITANFKDSFWGGVAYRQHYGTAFIVGFKATNSISVSYAYKTPNAHTYSYSNPAHEIQIGLYLPKKKIKEPVFVENTDSLEAKKEEVVKKEKPPEVKKDTVIAKVEKVDEKAKKEEIAKQKEDSLISQNKQDVRMTVKGQDPNDLDISNYLVVGSFMFEKNAKSFVNTLRNETFDAKIGYNSTNQRHYVFVYQSDLLADTLTELEKVRSISGFEDAWILKIVHSKQNK